MSALVSVPASVWQADSTFLQVHGCSLLKQRDEREGNRLRREGGKGKMGEKERTFKKNRHRRDVRNEARQG